jgi:hypothetical protein
MSLLESDIKDALENNQKIWDNLSLNEIQNSFYSKDANDELKNEYGMNIKNSKKLVATEQKSIINNSNIITNNTNLSI